MIGVRLRRRVCRRDYVSNGDVRESYERKLRTSSSEVTETAIASEMTCIIRKTQSFASNEVTRTAFASSEVTGTAFASRRAFIVRKARSFASSEVTETASRRTCIVHKV
jgi:hypothetical protein